MPSHVLFAGLGATPDQQGRIRSLCATRGLFPLFIDRWDDWRISIFPTSGAVEISSSDGTQRATHATIKGILLFDDPTVPPADAADVVFQRAEYEAMLAGLCACLAPRLLRRWQARAAGWSDASSPANENAACHSLQRLLRKTGPCEAVILDGAIVVQRVDGPIEVLELEAVGYPPPSTLSWQRGTTNIRERAGRVARWIIDSDQALNLALSSACADHQSAFPAVALGVGQRRVSDRGGITILAYETDTVAQHLARAAASRALDARFVALNDYDDMPESSDEAQPWLDDLSSAQVVFARVIAAGDSTTSCPEGAPHQAAVRRALARRQAPTINMPGAGFSNSYKAAHIRELTLLGLKVPETIVTNDPRALGRFLADHQRLVYKSCSSMRSLVHDFRTIDLPRIALLPRCPCLFQVRVEGPGCRAHVVADCVSSVAIEGATIDYRAPGSGARLTPIVLPEPLNESLILASQRLGLLLAGWDLIHTRGSESWAVLECNVMPAFDYYDSRSGTSTASLILDFMSGATA